MVGAMTVPFWLVRVMRGTTRDVGRPQGAVEMTVRHLLLLLIALGFIVVLDRHRLATWGLNLHNWGTSLTVAAGYAMVYAPFVALAARSGPSTGESPPTFPTRPNRFDLIGALAFHWLAVGLVEEVMFRGLVQTFLSHTWSGSLRIAGLDVPTAGVWAALMFAAVHIYPRLNVEQVVIAFVFGIVAAITYASTGSLLGPILMHNIGDGLGVTAQLLRYRQLTGAWLPATSDIGRRTPG